MLRTRNILASAALISTLTVVLAPRAWADWDWSCEFRIRCSWSLTSEGAQPVVPPEVGTYTPDSTSGDGSVNVDPCIYRQVEFQPPADSADWLGRDPEHGRLWQRLCPTGVNGTFLMNGANAVAFKQKGPAYYVPDGTPPDFTSTVDPAVVAQQAVGSLTIPLPTPHFGPDPTSLAVKVPVWLWVDPVPPIVRTTTAGPLTATVRAELESTTWDMGEPVNPDRPGQSTAAVECAGSGVPYSPGMDRAHPPCGYTYRWRSLPERTGGTGTWTATVTAHWTISWTVSTGLTGTEEQTTTTTVPVTVREWRTVLESGVSD